MEIKSGGTTSLQMVDLRSTGNNGDLLTTAPPFDCLLKRNRIIVVL